MAPIVELGNELGIYCEALHASFAKLSRLWVSDEEDADIVMDTVMTSLKTAAKLGIKNVVIHSSCVYRPHTITDRGLSRYDKFVEYASENNVTIAFENLRDVENLDFIMDRYKNNKNVGFCYDLGHEYCFTPNIRWMERFGDRLSTTHIHDNFGYPDPFVEDGVWGDHHLLPFDGNLDYSKAMLEMNKYDYKGALVLETGNYLGVPNEEYLKVAYQKLKKVSQM